MTEYDQARLIGATHEAARILIWVRAEIGRLREQRRVMPAQHVRRIAHIEAIMAPLLALERRISEQHKEMRAHWDDFHYQVEI